MVIGLFPACFISETVVRIEFWLNTVFVEEVNTKYFRANLILVHVGAI
jgi:hypothetical protein